MKYLKIYCFLLINLFFVININSAQAVLSNDLIENAKDYDGKVVKFRGEIIGDIMKRGDFSWINVSDEDNTIGVWIPVDLVSEITFAGDYKHAGDSVEILGEFHRACLEHHGELDIHAERLSILKKGEEKQESISPKKQKTTFVFLGVAICLGILKILVGRYKKT